MARIKLAQSSQEHLEKDKGKFSLQSRETSWRFLVARADVRSRVQTRWLRVTLIVNHIFLFLTDVLF